MSDTPRVAVLGVGALGCLFASRLRRVADVVVFGRWPEQVASLQDRPLLVHEIDGSQGQHFLTVSSQPDGFEPFDVVLFLVKGFQTEFYVDWAKRLLRSERSHPQDAPPGAVISLQNGLGHRKILDEGFGAQEPAYGVTYQAAHVERPGTLRHAGTGKTWLPDTAEGRRFAGLLSAAGLPALATEETETKVWQKLSVNAGFNPLTALLGVPNGALAEHQPLLDFAIAVSREVLSVANARGMTLDDEKIPKIIRTVSENTADNFSSMVTDRKRGGPTEIESICGAVVEAARAAGTDAPYCEALQARLLSPSITQEPDTSQPRLSPQAQSVLLELAHLERRFGSK